MALVANWRQRAPALSSFAPPNISTVLRCCLDGPSPANFSWGLFLQCSLPFPAPLYAFARCGASIRARSDRLAAEGADLIAATFAGPLPCPPRPGRLQAEQDALVPIGEAALNVLFLVLGDLPHDNLGSAGHLPATADPWLLPGPFPSGRIVAASITIGAIPFYLSHRPSPLCNGGLHSMPNSARTTSIITFLFQSSPSYLPLAFCTTIPYPVSRI